MNVESIKKMAELVEGSFVFTILRNDNTLFLVKGSNPLTIYHFPTLGLYVYASTKSILGTALQKSALLYKFCEIAVSEGEILQISPDGTLFRSSFAFMDDHCSFSPFYNWDAIDWYHDDAEELLLEMCSCYGINQEDIKLLLEFGYHYDEIEQMLMNTAQLTEALLEIKAVLSIE